MLEVREGGREGGKEGGKEGGREGGREGRREGGKMKQVSRVFVRMLVQGANSNRIFQI
jgi:hypothetical protein